MSDPRVTLLAFTSLTEAGELDVLERVNNPSAPGYTTPCDHLAEIAGRECYQSFGRNNPKTAANRDYLQDQIVAKNHTSVLAHASFTFRLTGISRTLTHELIRHRFLAVSEVSQRYVDMRDAYTVTPPLFQGDTDADFEARDIINRQQGEAQAAYDALVSIGLRKLASIDMPATSKRKRARQAARYVLPGGTDTKMIVSGNVRAWRDFIRLRNSDGADTEIQEVAAAILSSISEYAPNSVADLVRA